MDRVAQHWDEWQARHDAAAPRYIDWADHPTVLALLQGELFGDASTTVLEWLKTRYPRFTSGRALSLCCGDGVFEAALVQLGVFGSVVGTDLSPVRVEDANANRGPLADRLEYRVADADEGDFGEQAFDVVFAKAALHHLEDFDAVFAGVKRCLKPGGRLVAIDFFGPTRFQWTDAQLDAANAFLDSEVPRELRAKADGSIHSARRPTVEEMIALDPSEAVRSGDLLAAMHRHFEFEHDFAVGGALLNLVLDGSIVNHFDPADERHNEVIGKAFRRERELMAEGTIASDFRLVIVHPKSKTKGVAALL